MCSIDKFLDSGTPVYATQGGGYATRGKGQHEGRMVWLAEIPDFVDAEVGDPIPDEWSVVAINGPALSVDDREDYELGRGKWDVFGLFIEEEESDYKKQARILDGADEDGDVFESDRFEMEEEMMATEADRLKEIDQLENDEILVLASVFRRPARHFRGNLHMVHEISEVHPRELYA